MGRTPPQVSSALTRRHLFDEPQEVLSLVMGIEDVGGLDRDATRLPAGEHPKKSAQRVIQPVNDLIALSVIVISSGQTLVQHLVMLQYPMP